MRFRIALLFFYIGWGVVACNNNGTQRNDQASTSDSTVSSVEQTGLALEPSLKKADSLQILYYDNPDGDSLRYTRFYQYTITKDTTAIQQMLASLEQPVEQRREIRKCRSEGKIYVFGKEQQEPLKTIYFSTRCDTCCYLYFIKDGLFYYSPVSATFRNTLKENRTVSRKP